MSKKQEVKEFIWSFINPNDEECGWIEFTDENMAQIEDLGFEYKNWSLYKNDEYFGDGLDAVIKIANLKYDLDIQLKCVGGFDSPGYNINCYAWAGIIDGELYFDEATDERY